MMSNRTVDRDNTRARRRPLGRWMVAILAASAPIVSAAPQAPRSSAYADVSEAQGARDAVASDYVIGPEDQLSIVFWREKDLSADVVVRSDGKISLPLLNDVQASGLTPEQLRQELMTAAARFVEAPSATVVVKEIASRKAFITGMVVKPGAYALSGRTTVLQLIAMAGGLQEFANAKKIVVLRRENGREIGYRFNYKAVMDQKNPEQNIDLRPGDTVVVP
jgi:polysaccharide biosynthesis/export protein